MVGSKRYFQYESDSGLTHAVELDESVYETGALGFAPIDTGSNGPLINERFLQVSASRPLTMRYVNARAVRANGDVVNRRFYVGNPNEGFFTGAVITATIDGLQYSRLSSVGQVTRGIPLQDTAQDDGDVDDNFVTAGP